MFGAAGRLDWGRGWLYLALLCLAQGTGAVVVWRRDPELSRRRGRPGPGTPRWDFVLLGLFGLGYAATVVVAALDAARFAWSRPPGWTWGLGATFLALGTALTTWAMTVNTHFEKTVRIQSDRGHRVVDAGPYAVVRHPGYVGAIAAFPLAAPLLLGSSWALLPAALTVSVLVARTRHEDRLLRQELPGYLEYAGRVRYRLVPGLW